MLLSIIYQDEYIVVINKPSGLLIHRSMLDKHETQFAVQLLRDQIGLYVFPVHRLDRPTSGILVFALSADIARELGEQFASQTVKKTYLAIVRGHIMDEGKIDYALKEKLDKIADKMANSDKPRQQAVTVFNRLDKFELPFAVSKYASARYSLVQLTPKTGRKHQLRRHLAHINHPIVGDVAHGDGKHNTFIKQQFDFTQLALTCKSLLLKHPISQAPLFLRCDLDKNILGLLEKWQVSHHLLHSLNKL
jgi:tRNA pseudouridine65 synthase